MSNSEIQDYLTGKGIKPTPNRVLVYRELNDAKRPMNLADLEIALESMDRASIFRVLELFAGKEIVHVIEDGTRSLKYEVCHGGNHHSVEDEHVHFYCERCNRVFCLEDTPVPHVEVPESFKVRTVNFMIKGICSDCINEQ